MTSAMKSSALAASWHGIFAAMQPRLLLLWLLGLWLPTALVAFPLWQAMGAQLDHSVHAAEWARHFDLGVAVDLTGAMARAGYSISAGLLPGLVLTVLLSPWLTGMSVTAARSPRALGFGALLQGGLSEYGRMFRLLLLSLLPMGVAIAAGGGMFSWASTHAEKAILASSADHYNLIAMIVAGIAFVVAHTTVEAGRAQFAADPQLRSAIRAWWRGLMLVLRRPFSTLGVYLLISVIGLLIAAGFGMWRTHVAPLGALSIVGAFVLTQAISASLGWMRSARLFALTRLVAR
jgi:hypothetical protein